MGRMAKTAVAALAAVLGLAVAGVLVADAVRAERLPEDTRVGTVEVGGLERAEARARVQRELAGAVRRPVEATFRDKRFELGPDDAGMRLDAQASVDAAFDRARPGNPLGRVLGGGGGATVAPRVRYSERAVERFAARVAAALDREARDADIDWHDGKLERTRARDGLEVRRGELVERVAAVLASPAKRRTVEVPVKVTDRPDRTLADLAKRYPTVIAVDRDAKRLRLYKDLELEHKYRIAVGKAGFETDAGRYRVQSKRVDPAWHAPNSEWAGELAGQTIPPGDPRNPLKARWIGFNDQKGEGIHGTSDIDSLGGAASHGCIRMSVPDVEQLYRLVDKGTPVFIQ